MKPLLRLAFWQISLTANHHVFCCSAGQYLPRDVHVLWTLLMEHRKQGWLSKGYKVTSAFQALELEDRKVNGKLLSWLKLNSDKIDPELQISSVFRGEYRSDSYKDMFIASSSMRKWSVAQRLIHKYNEEQI